MILESHLPDEPPFASAVHTVKPITCSGPFDYWRGVLAAWNTDETLIIVEHDMECSDGLIQALIDDPHPLATFAYPLYWASTGKPDPQYAQRVGEFPPDRKYLGTPISEGDEWADYSGIGLCKIAPEARLELIPYGDEPESHWQHVDMAVNAAVKGRWHVLWPEVDHRHV